MTHNWKAFGSGSNSNGQFWYGSQTNFPGFLYKKNLGVGGRRSTKFNPGGNITSNSYAYLYNKYKPGTGGVGASSTSNRRAKNRLSTVCTGNNGHCGEFYHYLGRYSVYTENQNGYFPYPPNPNGGNPLITFISPASVSNFGAMTTRFTGDGNKGSGGGGGTYSISVVNPIPNSLGNFYSVSSSSSGKNIVVINANIFNPSIYFSTNYGETFQQSNVANHDFTSICMATDANIMFSPAIRDLYFSSNNKGNSFSQTIPNGNGQFWSCNCCTSNGGFILIGIIPNSNLIGGGLFISTNKGKSFNNVLNYNNLWSSVATSSNGRLCLAVSYDGYVCYSTNMANSWNFVNVPAYSWSSVSTNSNGNLAAVCSLDGYIYISKNISKTNWVSVAPNSFNWTCIFISPNGKVILVAGVNTPIYYTTNNGTTWNFIPKSPSEYWSSITTNNDASIITAVINGGGIYIIKNFDF